ncbi:MAG: M23 family metallopeptidase [Anaerolineae bacterium]|nr:M23 family metallopeptidase [Anaerolineae bacterium]
MRGNRPKQRKPLTLILVPQDERAPQSWRIPLWFAPSCVVLVVLFLCSMAYFAIDYHQLKQENQALRAEREAEIARQREMRTVILVQQDQVRQLGEQVTSFEKELSSVRLLAQHVRSLLRLEATPTPSPQPSQFSNYQEALVQRAGIGIGGIEWDPSHHEQMGMFLALAKTQDVIEMESTLPSLLQELQALDSETQSRLQRLDVEALKGTKEIERELRLLAAAPHAWPTKSRFIISPFGYRVLNGKVDFHTGVDFPVWYGTKVHATEDGTVVYAGWKHGYGWVVEIQHEMGFSTIYAHNSRILVHKGDKVKQGKVIALSGASGWATGPHLHYEIRLNGKPVNPVRYLGLEER